MEKGLNRKLEAVLKGKSFETPPIWLMRQAGRYLPEYRKVRKIAGSFLELCYTPELAIEVTLQPIRRFQFDAAILFSDILVIPDALGRKVEFVENQGPLLEPIDVYGINRLDNSSVVEKLEPVLETVRGLRQQLPEEMSLIGFCGAPWTVATYMIAGKGTPDQGPARLFGMKHPEAMQKLLEVLAEASASYLIAQLQAGAGVVQIFDSWAGVLGDDQFEQWCVKPVKKIVDEIRRVVPDALIIGFPKGAGSRLKKYRAKTGVSGLGLDWTVSFEDACGFQRQGAVQGLLDPMRLVAGGNSLDRAIDDILENLGEGPLIFNLGHGIVPQTPIENVERLVRRVRGD